MTVVVETEVIDGSGAAAVLLSAAPTSILAFTLTPESLRYVLLQGHSMSEDYIVLHCAKGH